METIIRSLTNHYVLMYIFFIFFLQFLLVLQQRSRDRAIEQRRIKAGLSGEPIVGTQVKLETVKSDALWHSMLFVVTALLLPMTIIVLARFDLLPIADKEVDKIGLVFLAFLLWILLNGTDVIKSFLGGMACKTLLALAEPFQIGDRVTLKGISGTVKSIGLFYVKLQTPDDNAVSIPTSGLWPEILVSSNAGDRASMCVMPFYLAPFATQEQILATEETMIEAIQSSPYFDMSKPMKVFMQQQENAIVLTAKSYVATTYNEPLFSSDVTRVVLDFTSKNNIPLASSAWKIDAGQLR